jgi:hypothetical protein
LVRVHVAPRPVTLPERFRDSPAAGFVPRRGYGIGLIDRLEHGVEGGKRLPSGVGSARPG